MNIAVLIKMVPDTESRLEIVDGKVKEDGFKYMVNPYDEFAVEQAVQFKENVGGKVTLVCLFSNNSGIDTDLRKMMAIGADEAIVLRQDEYQGDKPSSNSKLLAEAVKELNADLVIGLLSRGYGTYGCSPSKYPSYFGSNKARIKRRKNYSQ